MTIICVRPIEKSDLSNPTYPINLTWNLIQIQPNQLNVSDLSRSPTYRELTLYIYIYSNTLTIYIDNYI